MTKVSAFDTYSLSSFSQIDFPTPSEILPSISMLKSGIPIHVSTVEMDAKTLASDSASASASTPRLSAGSLSKLLTFNLYLFLLVLLNAISFAPYATGASSSVTEGIFKQLLSAFHVDSSTKKLLVEAYIASLCWGTTYLFVRRIWNPENAPISQALRKFAADAVFGGLAAGAAVIMKSLLVRVLV